MPTDEEYRRLLALRIRLREFDQWSRDAAAAHGLTHAQHQLLLAVRGHADGEPTIGEAAEALLVKRHTASELVDRTVALGLLVRVRDDADHRRVLLRLTPAGREVLHALTDVHLDEFRRLAPLLDHL